MIEIAKIAKKKHFNENNIETMIICKKQERTLPDTVTLGLSSCFQFNNLYQIYLKWKEISKIMKTSSCI